MLLMRRCFLAAKGEFRDAEAAWDAAVREFKEEIGVSGSGGRALCGFDILIFSSVQSHTMHSLAILGGRWATCRYPSRSGRV